ncbi:hypothetical protein [Geminisphaera colitermitum]|uniref:hypothetical protein n=1 Tax=Geminisphaera colitermitum TaxID=1148786 RepID=UPI000158D581|nr:hypothetical protein [Geminisphaera colitermitum]
MSMTPKQRLDAAIAVTRNYTEHEAASALYYLQGAMQGRAQWQPCHATAFAAVMETAVKCVREQQERLQAQLTAEQQAMGAAS